MKPVVSALIIAGTISSTALPSNAASAHGSRRGYLDGQWSSGYVVREHGNCVCGQFVVCPGCSGLTPLGYRGFADQIFFGTAPRHIGYSWYLGGMAEPADGAIETAPLLPAPELPPAPAIEQ